MKIQNIVIVANADLRLAANQKAWPMQVEVEAAIVSTFDALNISSRRGHDYDETKEHGFIDSQKMGMEVFRNISSSDPLVVVLSTWQYSHHILAGLMSHDGPILTVANFSGTWPGLVGLLNLNASLTKAGVNYSTLWSSTFEDDFFLERIREWVGTGEIIHNRSHARPFQADRESMYNFGASLGHKLVDDKAIIGVFDEGCMGMFNAIIPDHLLNSTGIFKERLSQSALYHETLQISDGEAEAAFDWLQTAGMSFYFGPDESTDLTRTQVLLQLKMYIAAMRMADDFGCSAIGIQYQQGLKDLLPASDLAEGLLNNSSRPPVSNRHGETLFGNAPLPHFNEVDECAAIDALVTNRVWTALKFEPETTLHDVRWGDTYNGDFVWVFEISGAAPPAHFVNGYHSASSMRQPPMYFRLGGGTLRGVSKPGRIVWSRVYIENNELCADIGTGRVVELPHDESERRWKATNYEWPIMHAILDGVSRDQLMAKHKSNHIQVAYTPDAPGANDAMNAKAGMFAAMGIKVIQCGRM